MLSIFLRRGLICCVYLRPTGKELSGENKYPHQNSNGPIVQICLVCLLLSVNKFILFTDHKPLTFALFRTSLPWSAMHQRRLSFLSEFNCKIHHLPGPETVIADVLSHPESSNLTTTPITLISVLHPPPQISSQALSLKVPWNDLVERFHHHLKVSLRA